MQLVSSFDGRKKRWRSVSGQDKANRFGHRANGRTGQFMNNALRFMVEKSGNPYF
jgi:hypothetical protein